MYPVYTILCLYVSCTCIIYTILCLYVLCTFTTCMLTCLSWYVYEFTCHVSDSLPFPLSPPFPSCVVEFSTFSLIPLFRVRTHPLLLIGWNSVWFGQSHFVFHLQRQGCLLTPAFFQRTHCSGHLADCREILAEFFKKCIGKNRLRCL